ncbi:hypothetical protein C8Q75DRAFT_730680 [Abortiporus biennis]|nr:hypothetical protein C8Q75DRAFT_730680 [Abortiporus biennis]
MSLPRDAISLDDYSPAKAQSDDDRVILEPVDVEEGIEEESGLNLRREQGSRQVTFPICTSIGAPLISLDSEVPATGVPCSSPYISNISLHLALQQSIELGFQSIERPGPNLTPTPLCSRRASIMALWLSLNVLALGRTGQPYLKITGNIESWILGIRKTCKLYKVYSDRTENLDVPFVSRRFYRSDGMPCRNRECLEPYQRSEKKKGVLVSGYGQVYESGVPSTDIQSKISLRVHSFTVQPVASMFELEYDAFHETS